VIMATTVAKRMTNGREDFWIRILIAFILCGFLLWVFFVLIPVGSRAIASGGVPAKTPAERMSSARLKIR
jgi:hypothetical protein